MLIRIFFLLLLSSLSLSACMSPVLYQPSNANSFGYRNTQVDGALHRVSYIARAGAGYDLTYGYTMYRAAELAQSHNATHFEVLEGPIDRNALTRFENRVLKVSATDFEAVGVTVTVEDASALPKQHTHSRTQTFIYIPVSPPPPPQSVSVLIRLLNAPSLDANRGFDVNDLLRRLGPEIQRPMPPKSS